jgi:hypothetical protein
MARNRRSLSDDDLLLVLGATGFCYSAVARITGFSRGCIERRVGNQPLRGRAVELRKRLEGDGQLAGELPEEAIVTSARHAEFSRMGFDPENANPSIPLARIGRLAQRLDLRELHHLLDSATNLNLLQVYRLIDRHADSQEAVFRAIREESACGIRLLGKEP